MASHISTYLGNKIVRWLGGNAMPSAPASVYVALFNGDPKSGGTEVTTTIRGAGRVAAAFSAPSAGSTNTMATNADTDFGTAAGGATVTHVALYDASSSGNLLISRALASSVVIGAGELVKIASGALSFEIGGSVGNFSAYLGNKILRWLAGNAFPSAPSSIYSALFNGDPKGAGSEVTATIRGAGRLALTLSVPSSGTTNTMSSSADSDYGNADAGATVDYLAVYDAGSSGNLLCSKSVSSQSIAAGEQVVLPSGQVTFQFGS